MTLVRVTVCIAAYRRPEALDRLLSSLASIDTTTSDGGQVELSVIVVDNDASATAESVVVRHRSRLPDLMYAVEPRKGFAQALNRLVALALDPPRATPDFLAFVDDDNWVDPSWLRAFLSCAARMQCVYVGPMVPHFEEGVPGWIEDGRFFERPRHPSGTRIRFAVTGNLLVPASVLASFEGGRIFERALDLGSVLLGPDTLFSILVHQLGHEIRWCDEALVRTGVSRERTSARWLVKRAFAHGAAYSQVTRIIGAGRMELAGRVASGAGHLGLGLLALPLGVVRGRTAALQAARRSALGLGALAGLVYPMPAARRRTEGRR
jgi:glycosyltransferase involved in cell wall biosynthesis